MQNRSNVNNKKTAFNEWASAKQPLKRNSIFYTRIEGYPDDRFEDHLLFEIDFRTNRTNAKKLFAERDMKSRVALHEKNMIDFLSMIEILKDDSHIKIDTKLSDQEILDQINQARKIIEQNKGRIETLNFRFKKVSDALLRAGRNATMKTRQEKASDFLFIWDCLERTIVLDGEEKENRLSNEYIKDQISSYYNAPMHPKTFQNYRDVIIDCFSIDTERLEFKLLR